MAKADHELAAALGVPVNALLAIKQGPEAVLVKGVHWNEEIPSGRHSYTDEGLALVRSLLAPEKKEGAARPVLAGLGWQREATDGLDPQKREGGAADAIEPTPPAADAQDGASDAKKEGPGEVLSLFIHLCHPNPTGIKVRTPNNTGADVRVRNNRTLRKGQKILCRQHGDGTWECMQPGQHVPYKIPAPRGASTETTQQ